MNLGKTNQKLFAKVNNNSWEKAKFWGLGEVYVNHHDDHKGRKIQIGWVEEGDCETREYGQIF